MEVKFERLDRDWARCLVCGELVPDARVLDHTLGHRMVLGWGADDEQRRRAAANEVSRLGLVQESLEVGDE